MAKLQVMETQTAGEGQTLQQQDTTVQAPLPINITPASEAPIDTTQTPPIVATVPTEQEAARTELPPIPQAIPQTVDPDSIAGDIQSISDINVESDPQQAIENPIDDQEDDFSIPASSVLGNPSEIEDSFSMPAESVIGSASNPINTTTTKPIIQPKKIEQKLPSIEKKIYSYPDKPENEYRITNGVWQKKKKGIDSEWFSVENQGSVDALNKLHKTQAKPFNGSYSYTDENGKQNKYEYRRTNDLWEKREKGNDESFYPVTNIGSISALDRQWGTKTKKPTDETAKNITTSAKILTQSGLGVPTRGFAQAQSFYSDGTPVIDRSNVAQTLFSTPRQKGLEIELPDSGTDKFYFEQRLGEVDQARQLQLNSARTPQQIKQVNDTFDKEQNKILGYQNSIGKNTIEFPVPTKETPKQKFDEAMEKSLGFHVSQKGKDPITLEYEKQQATKELSKLINETDYVSTFLPEAKNFTEKNLGEWFKSEGVILSPDQQGQLGDYQSEVKSLLKDPITNKKRITEKIDESKKFIEKSQRINNNINEANGKGISLDELMVEHKTRSINSKIAKGSSSNATDNFEQVKQKFDIQLSMYNFMKEYIDRGKIKVGENGQVEINITDPKELKFVNTKLAGFQGQIQALEESTYNSVNDEVIGVEDKIRRYNTTINRMKERVDNMEYDISKGESILDVFNLTPQIKEAENKRDYLVSERDKLKGNSRNFFLTEPQETAKTVSEFSTPTTKAIWRSIPKNLTPKQQFDMFYTELEKDTKEFGKANGVDESILDKYGQRVRDAFDIEALGLSLSKEEKEYFKRVKTLHSLQSLYYNNDLGFTKESGGFWESFTNGLAKGLKPSTSEAEGYLSQTEAAKVIKQTIESEGFDKADVVAATKLNDLKKRGETSWASLEGFGEMTGQTAAIVGQIVVSAPALGAPMGLLKGGVRLVGLIDKAQDTQKIIKGIETTTKAFDDYLFNSTKTGRFIKQPIEQGLQFEIAGEVFNDPNNELQFLQGFVGTLGANSLIKLYGTTKKALGLTQSIFGESTPKAVSVFQQIVARGSGEVTEESLQELTSIYNDELRTRGFWDEVGERYGNMDNVMQLVVSSFIMGGAFGLATPQSSQDIYDDLPKEKQAVVDNVVQEVMDDVMDANIEADEVAKDVSEKIIIQEEINKTATKVGSEVGGKSKTEKVEPIGKPEQLDEKQTIIENGKTENKGASDLGDSGSNQEAKGKRIAIEQIKNPTAKEAVQKDVFTPEEKTMQYFIGGGKINSSVIESIYGNKKDKPTKGEIHSRIGLMNNKSGQTIEGLADLLWNQNKDALPQFDSTDYRNAIESVVSQNLGTRSMIDSVSKQVSEEDYYVQKYGEIGELQPEFIDEAETFFDALSDEEKQSYFDQEQISEEAFIGQYERADAVEEKSVVKDSLITESTDAKNTTIKQNTKFTEVKSLIEKIPAEFKGDEDITQFTVNQQTGKPIATELKELFDKGEITEDEYLAEKYNLDSAKQRYTTAGQVKLREVEAKSKGESVKTTKPQIDLEEVVSEPYGWEDDSDVYMNPQSTQRRGEAPRFMNKVQELLGENFKNIDVQTDRGAFVSNAKRLGKDPKIAAFVDSKTGTIYLNPDKANENTAIEEYAHIWMDLAEQVDSSILEKGKSLIENSEAGKAYIDEVMNDKGYSDIHSNKTAVQKEALAKMISDRGYKIVNDKNDKPLRTWLKDFWRAIAKKLGLVSGKINTNTDTLEQYVDKIARELLNGKSVSNMTKEQFAQIYDKTKTPQLKIEQGILSELGNADKLRIWFRDKLIPLSRGANKAIVEQVQKTQGLVSKVNKKGEFILKDLKKGLDNYLNAIGDTSIETRKATLENVQKALTDVKFRSEFFADPNVEEYLQNPIQNMRNMVTSLSRLLRASGIVSKDSDLIVTMTANMDIYLNKSYKARTVGGYDWKKSLTPQQVEMAYDWVNKKVNVARSVKYKKSKEGSKNVYEISFLSPLGVESQTLKFDGKKEMQNYIDQLTYVGLDSPVIERVDTIFSDSEGTHAFGNNISMQSAGVNLPVMTTEQINAFLDEMTSVEEEKTTDLYTKNGLTKTQASAFMKKTEMDAEYDMIMGAVTDPMINFAKTIVKQADILYKTQLEKTILKDAPHLFSGTQTATNSIKIPKSQSLNLGEKWTTPEFYNFMFAAGQRRFFSSAHKGLGETDKLPFGIEMLNNKQGNALLSALTFLSAATKKNLTVRSPSSNARNVLGAFEAMIKMGEFPSFNAKKGVKTAGALREDFDMGFTGKKIFGRKFVPKTDAVAGYMYNAVTTLVTSFAEMTANNKTANRKLIQELVQQRILNTSLDANLINDMSKVYTKEGEIDKAFVDGVMNSINQRYKKFSDSENKSYQFSDNIPKALAYLSLKNKYAQTYGNLFRKQGMSETMVQQKIKEMASSAVRNQMPNYEMTPELVREISKNPFIGTFVMFGFSSMRNDVQILKNIGELIRDKKEMKSAGLDVEVGKMNEIIAKKLAGFAMVNTFTQALVKYAPKILIGLGIIGSMKDWGDDEDEALRSLASDYRKYNSLLVTGGDGKSTVQYIDLSNIDVQNQWQKLYIASKEDGFSAGLGTILEPYSSGDIGLNILIDIYNGESEYGKSIGKGENMGVNALKGAGYFLNEMTRNSIIGQAEKMKKGFFNEKSEYEQFTLQNEMSSWFLGLKTKTIDIPKSFKSKMRSVSFQIQKSNDELKKYISQGDSEFSVDNEKEAVINTINESVKKASEMVYSMRKLNYSPEEIGTLLEFTKADANGVERRQIPDYIVDKLLNGEKFELDEKGDILKPDRRKNGNSDSFSFDFGGF